MKISTENRLHAKHYDIWCQGFHNEPKYYHEVHILGDGDRQELSKYSMSNRVEGNQED